MMRGQLNTHMSEKSLFTRCASLLFLGCVAGCIQSSGGGNASNSTPSVDPQGSTIMQGSLGQLTMTDPVLSPMLSFSASKNIINTGDVVLLEWNSPNAESCFAVGDWPVNGVKPVMSSEMLTLVDAKTYLFTLVCNIKDASTSQTVLVTAVKKPPEPAPIADDIKPLFQIISQFD